MLLVEEVDERRRPSSAGDRVGMSLTKPFVAGVEHHHLIFHRLRLVLRLLEQLGHLLAAHAAAFCVDLSRSLASFANAARSRYCASSSLS